MGVVVGLPVVPGPSAEVTTMPSLTIDVTFVFSASLDAHGEVHRRRCPPDGMARPVHLTLPLLYVPPLSADMKVVLSGIGSVMVTPVASALPMFLRVRV